LGIIKKKQKIKKEDTVQLKKTEDENEENSTLFIKNLNFETNEEKLIKLFSEIGEIKSLKIIKDDNKKSKGYGFVEFKNLNGI
jgi:RNA recognition motif-containing protein